MSMMINPYVFAAGGGGGPALWTPLDMLTIPPIYLDADASMVTEVSGAVSAISNLGALGAGGDFSQSDSTKRPTMTTLGGTAALSFDGVNDVLACGSDTAKDVHRNKGYPWIFAVYSKRGVDGSPAGRGLVITWAGTIGLRTSMYAGYSSTGSANKPTALYKSLDGSSVGVTALNPVAVTTPAILLAQFRFGSGQLIGHTNGSQTSTLSTGVSTTSDTRGTNPIYVGAETTTSGFSDADIAAIIIGNTDIPAADRERLEGWAAHKWGLTASLPGGHPYKTVAPTV